MTLRYFFINGFEIFSQSFIYGFVYWYYAKSIETERLLRVTETEKLQLQKNLLQTERDNLDLENKNLRLQEDLLQSQNDFLRAQINPHFLYNCLNFFYTQTYDKVPHVAEGVIALSDMMRYSLKDYTTTNGLANLNEEIEHIENVIRMHQLRFSDVLNIEFHVQGNPVGKQVAPMVFITLVENVFKHGELQDEEAPAVITCRIDEQQQTVFFSVHNKKNKLPAKISTGIGLKNIRQRLTALHKENYSHSCRDEGDFYTEELTIPYVESVKKTTAV